MDLLDLATTRTEACMRVLEMLEKNIEDYCKKSCGNFIQRGMWEEEEEIKKPLKRNEDQEDSRRNVRGDGEMRKGVTFFARVSLKTLSNYKIH